MRVYAETVYTSVVRLIVYDARVYISTFNRQCMRTKCILFSCQAIVHYLHVPHRTDKQTISVGLSVNQQLGKNSVSGLIVQSSCVWCNVHLSQKYTRSGGFESTHGAVYTLPFYTCFHCIFAAAVYSLLLWRTFLLLYWNNDCFEVPQLKNLPPLYDNSGSCGMWISLSLRKSFLSIRVMHLFCTPLTWNLFPLYRNGGRFFDTAPFQNFSFFSVGSWHAFRYRSIKEQEYMEYTIYNGGILGGSVLVGCQIALYPWCNVISIFIYDVHYCQCTADDVLAGHVHVPHVSNTFLLYFMGFAFRLTREFVYSCLHWTGRSFLLKIS